MDTKLSIIFYSAIYNKSINDLLDIIFKMWKMTETYDSFHEFLARLRQSIYDIIGVIIVIQNISELDEIIFYEDLIRNLPVILVLPDKEKTTKSKGHLIRPKLISYVGGNNTDVMYVLKGIINNKISQVNRLKKGMLEIQSERR